MKSLFPFLILFVMTGASWARADESKPLTLADCYALTLERSEKIGIQKELIEETEGRFLRALGAVLPHLSFASSDKRQDGSGGSAFTLKNVPERKFELNQTLFGGFKEAAAMAISRKERKQRVHEKERIEQLLLLDVSNAFYLLLEEREDLKAVSRTRKTLAKRITELQERERLGRSRPSEVASVRADLRRIEAEEELVRSQETVAREILEFLTGRTPLGEIVDTAFLPLSLEAEEHYLKQAVERPDLKALQEAWEVSRKQIVIARSPLWPSVSAEGNYYTERAGAAAGVDWDATLEVNVPIFEGGQAYGAIKEAKARAQGAELRFSEAKRSASLDIRDTYVRLQAALERTRTLEKAVDASEEDYRLQVEDYRRNLVNNLDVLESLKKLYEADRDFIHASYEAKRLYWELRVAVGETL